MGVDVVVPGRLLRNVAVLAVVIGVTGIALWQVTQLRSRAGDTGAGDAGTGLTLYQGSKGIPVPEIEGATITGDNLSLPGLRGHVVVLNVWGSWCAPCRAEAPDLSAIARESEPRGVRFVGIDVRDNPAADSRVRAQVRHHVPEPSTTRAVSSSPSSPASSRSVPSPRPSSSIAKASSVLASLVAWTPRHCAD
ncbi:TlpA family protein disulfide reductase [Nocardioides sp. W3-2-3]|nr:TlpA family protein disulfide reductase [Nocardioides convexus]